MTLIRTISGIRGTIGGSAGSNLTPPDIIKYATAFGWIIQRSVKGRKARMIVGRDARISGDMVLKIICGSLNGLGIDVIDLGLASTPTVEMAVILEKADGGIIITASHNPSNWNALKLLNHEGEFISDFVGTEVLRLAEEDAVFSTIPFAGWNELGNYSLLPGFTKRHIEAIISLKAVDVPAIKSAGFKVVVDAVNSVGGLAVPELLNALGVNEVICLHCEPNGIFAHNPEPLASNLGDLINAVSNSGAHLGVAVDPDVDRLAIVNEDGTMFGEEYTLVAVADYILSHSSGSTVSNLSSTRALRDVTRRYNQEYYAAAVGEVNVVQKMKETNAIIGGEGNGGVIYPALHYGRDALVGIALFLSHLARENTTCSKLKSRYPAYYMVKEKLQLEDSYLSDQILSYLGQEYQNQPEVDVNLQDGVKLDFTQGWVHVRKSNTEPIIRIYAEARTENGARQLSSEIQTKISDHFRL